MGLRSGRVLKVVSFKRKVTRKALENDITKQIRSLKVEADKDPWNNSELLEELKLFLRSLFYHCCKENIRKEGYSE